jgi:hypothetical protein
MKTKLAIATALTLTSTMAVAEVPYQKYQLPTIDEVTEFVQTVDEASVIAFLESKRAELLARLEEAEANEFVSQEDIDKLKASLAKVEVEIVVAKTMDLLDDLERVVSSCDFNA